MNSGARAEQLVAQLERVLGERVTVTTNERLPDRLGNPRESDVCVHFSQGGRDFAVVIEVRDRDGVDDIRWIDQIDGKWRDTGYRVVAVSASGFSEKAAEKARGLGIETLTLHETETHNWSIQFVLDHLSVLRNMVDIQHLSVHLTGADEAEEGFFRDLPDPIHESVYQNARGEAIGLLQLWDLNVRPRLGTEEIPLADLRMPFHVRLNFGEGTPLWLVHKGRRFPVTAVEMAGEHWAEEEAVPLLPAREYSTADGEAVRAGIIETAAPVSVGDRLAFAALVYVPEGGDDAGAKVSVVLRDAEQSRDCAEGY